MIKQPLSPRFFYLLSCIEGSAVMATELIGAKMLAPFFGSSLYVWATVLAITLGGLALGYFIGGILSYRLKHNMTLFYVLLIAAVLVMVMPFSSAFVMDVLGNYSLLPAIVACALLFLFPPVFMMGMVSPLIISYITTDVTLAGRIAGNIYAISTLGGIITTFLTGFYIIPNFGLTLPCIIIGFLLGILPVLVLLKNNKLVSLLFFAAAALSYYFAVTQNSNSGLQVRYRSEGLLGQVMVADWPVYNSSGKIKNYDRFLFVNRITQTRLSLATDSINGFKYVTTISKALSHLPKGARVLLMGLGGGSIANKLIQMEFNLQVCELDKRIYQVARDYFKLPEVTCHIDDARHFVRIAENKYDALILDVFRGEENPAHCFTIEAFNDMKKILSPNGVLIINGSGFISGAKGKGMRAVYKTLKAAGFSVDLMATANTEEESNLLFFAVRNGDRSAKFSLLPDVNYITLTAADIADAVVLEDDKPMLDKLNIGAYRAWRVASINYFENAAKNGQTAPYF